MAAMAVSNSGVLGGIQRDVSFPALLGTILIIQALHHSIYLRLQAKHVSLSEYLHCVEMVRTFKSLSSGTAKGSSLGPSSVRLPP